MTEMKQQTCGGKSRIILKFSKKTAAAARIYERMTGKPFKVG